MAREVQELPRVKKVVGAIMGAVGILLATESFIIIVLSTLAVADMRPKSVAVWVGLVFLVVLDVALLGCVGILVWMMYRLVKVRAT
jgi:hypothetical protein